jgi:hypothetical protein
MVKSADERGELEEKFGGHLTELECYQRKEKQEVEAKRKSYEAKLAKIDERLKDI